MEQLPKSGRRRGLLTIGAKLLLAVLLVLWLTRSGAITPSAVLRNGASLSADALAALCVLIALALGVFRWRLVMASLGVHIGYSRALQVYWIGAFAGTFLPGAATGDILRAFYVVREAPHARALAAASVVIDRVVGLAGFMLSGLALTLLRGDALRHSRELRELATSFGLILVAVLVSLLGAAWIGRRVFANGLMARSWGRLGNARRTVMTQIAAVGYPSLPALLTVLGISLMIPSLLTCALLPFISGVSLGYTSMIDIGIASNVAQVANTLPLTPGGIGIGEGTFEYVLALLRHPSPVIGYGTAFLSLRLVTVAVNAFGGVLFFLPGQRPASRLPESRR